MAIDIAPRAFFVLGPESSGTRLATEILINAGCHGSSDHTQPLDDPQFNLKSISPSTPIVWRRSFPHNFETPILSTMLDRVHPREAMAIVTVRDWYCVERSQVRDNQHATSIDQARSNLSRAYTLIFTKLHVTHIPFRMSVYEAMTTSPTAQVRFIESLGLTVPPKLIDTYDGNARYLTLEAMK